MKLIRKPLSIILSVILALSVFAEMPATALADGELETILVSAPSGSFFAIDEYEVITEETTTLENGYYVVAYDVTNNNRISVQGNDVHLVLRGGHTLNATKGISVNEGKALTIWEESGADYGSLISTGDHMCAGIGGDDEKGSGTITINGGHITATGANQGAGIGGGVLGKATEININGGVIEAHGADYGGAGIGAGGGSNAYGGRININGGEVYADGVVGIGNEDTMDDDWNPNGCVVTLSYDNYSKSGFYLRSSSFYAKIVIAEGKSFFDFDSGKVYEEGAYFNKRTEFPYWEYPTSEFDGKILRPYVAGWGLLQSLINDADYGETITLDERICYAATDGDGPLVIPEGKNITLDLNDCIINRNLSVAEINGCVINNNGVLTITGNGKIVGGRNLLEGGGIYNHGTLVIESGTITDNKASSGGAIYNVANHGEITINGGIIRDNAANIGGAVYNAGILTLNGGKIIKNKSSAGYNGGGIYSAGTVNLFGGEITDNTASANGGGVFASQGSTVNMSGSPVIKNNKSGDSDHNLFLDGMSINIVDALSESADVHVRGDFDIPITEGLYGNGTTDVFTSDAGYYVRANDEGEAVFASGHSITVNVNGKGSAETSVSDAPAGDTITITTTPDNPSCYVSRMLVYYQQGSVSVTVPVENNTFEMPDADVYVSIDFSQEATTYRDLDGDIIEVKDFTEINSNTTTLTTGWYLVSDDIVNANRIRVSGNVDLILGDGCEFNPYYGITVNSGNSLTIWGQADGDGTLKIDKTDEYSTYGSSGAGMQNAGIGGEYVEGNGNHNGNITINGGIISVGGGGQGAGIGGSAYGEGTQGTITINDGQVSAYVIHSFNGTTAAGIGGGDGRSGGNIIIDGGEVTAVGGDLAAGIGGGKNGNGGTITILGGVVDASSDAECGIGAGTNRSSAIITLGYSDDTKIGMAVKSDGYNGTVTMNNDFADENGIVYEAGTQDATALKNVTLRPYDDSAVKVDGYSLSLSGNIGVDFYMELDESVTSDEGAYMKFSLPNGSETEIAVSSVLGNPVQISGKTCYKFSCGVSAKEMTKPITAQVYSGENIPVGNTYTYTVKEYADYLVENAQALDAAAGDDRYSKAIPLVLAMLYYGGCAQTLFDYNTEDMADADLGSYKYLVPEISGVDGMVNNVPEQTVSTASGDATLQYYGSTLLLKSSIGYKLYFTSNAKAADLPNLINADTDEEYSPVNAKVNGVSYICYKIDDIYPQSIRNDITLKFEGGEAFTVNVGEYANLAKNSTGVAAETKAAVKALYNFADAVTTYVNR